MKEKKQNYSKDSQLKIEFSSPQIKEVVFQYPNIESGKVIRLSENIRIQDCNSNIDYSKLVLKHTKSF